jgi:hypothetical protein
MSCPEHAWLSWNASIDYKASIRLIGSPRKQLIKMLRGAIRIRTTASRRQVAAVNLGRTRTDGLLALKVEQATEAAPAFYCDIESHKLMRRAKPGTAQRSQPD